MLQGKMLTRIALAVVGVVVASVAALQGAEQRPLSCPFFAFDVAPGFRRLSADQQATMLKELGYDGIGYSGTRGISAMLRALDAQGLKMCSLYVGACLDANKPPTEAGLKEAMEQLRGRDTLIWLYVTGGTPSSDALDERAVSVIGEIADMANKCGLRVALYPHTGMYVARVEDAVRLAKKVHRKNLGASFNLCHFLKLDNEKNLEMRLKEAMPHLFAVSINGADGGDTNQMRWRNQLIQTLDRGSFDVGRVLRTLRQEGYEGPVGLQCWDVPGDHRENFARSMKAWRQLTARVNAE